MQGPQQSHSLTVDLDLTYPQKTKNYGQEYDQKIGLHGTWYMSEKLDGLRAIWDGKRFLTKQMRYYNFVPAWFTKGLPKFCLDGELIIPGKPFQYFSGLSVTKTEDPRWKEVKYKVFDIPIQNIPFEERLNRLKMVKGIELVDFRRIGNIKNEFEKVNNFFREVTNRGGEGVMLIKADSYYIPNKRVRHSLKYKKEMKGEAEIIEFCEGIGKYYQKLGKFKCKIPSTGKTFYCGSGLTDEIREMYKFDKKICYEKDPKAPEIGDKIEYSCMEILPSGAPRLAIFKRIIPKE